MARIEGEQASNLPSLEELINRSLAGFKQKEFFTSEYGKKEPQGPATAVEEVFGSLKIEDEYEFLKFIVQQTNLKPQDINIEFLSGADFPEMIRDLSELIVEKELVNRHPEIWEEYDRRNDELEQEERRQGGSNYKSAL